MIYGNTNHTKECIKEILDHKNKVRSLVNILAEKLIQAGKNHDNSKLVEPELSTFITYGPKLKETKYNSPEYKEYLKEMKPSLDNHYAKNSHHPEHYENGISGMNLIDLVEMICDWKASVERTKEGDVLKSIEVNQERFGYSDELKQILINTVNMFTEEPKEKDC